MIDLIFLAGVCCLLPYWTTYGFNNGWVTFSLLCCVGLLSCQLFLKDTGVQLDQVREVQTEVSKEVNGLYTTTITRTDCQVYQKNQTVYANWFLFTNVLRHGIIFKDTLLVEGRTCAYVEEYLL
ncbi:MAG: hypothetical protein GY928_39790 [Colwellia sp.]|nr:hypothetical protein [Colwellia sp.]